MKNCLQMNNNFIIRDEDKMLFSAKDMKIYRFNEKGFELIKKINNGNKIDIDELFNQINDKYGREEYDNFIKKMAENNIIFFSD